MVAMWILLVEPIPTAGRVYRHFIYDMVTGRPFNCFYRAMHCTVVQSAVLRSHVVHLSVTLVDQEHIGWKSWKLIAGTISPTPSLFVAQRPSAFSQGNMGKFWGD